MSDKSFKSWNYFKFFFTEVISNFSLILTMSKFDQNNFKKLGAKNVNFIGNLKFSNGELPNNKLLEKKVKKIVSNRLVWLASSTHHGEEIFAANIHLKLKQKYYLQLTLKHQLCLLKKSKIKILFINLPLKTIR